MKYLVTYIFILYSFNCLSYPIEPITLNEMIDISPFVAYGKVTSSYDTISFKDSKRPLSYATVKIEKMLVGYLEEKEIKIFYNANYICPSPANFVEDKMVTVFFDKKDGRYRTTGLSYSTKYIPEENKNLYHQRIIDNARIKDLHTGHEKEKLLTNWCIKNLDINGLKNDAEREINKALLSQFGSKEDRFMFNSNFKSIDIVNNWTKAHRQVIRQYLIEGEIKIRNLKSIKLLFTDYENEYRNFIIRALSSDINKGHLYRIKAYTELLFDMNLPSEAIIIYEEIANTQNLYKLDKENLISKVQRFLELISTE